MLGKILKTIVKTKATNKAIDSINNSRTKKTGLSRGDVVGVRRSKGYKHYGVYVNENEVIHYTDTDTDIKGTIDSTSLEDFKSGDSLFKVEFDFNGPVEFKIPNNLIIHNDISEAFHRLSKRNTKYSADDTISRAKSRIGEKNYNLLFNNCEHFVYWCKTGENYSSQIDDIFGRFPEIRL